MGQNLYLTLTETYDLKTERGKLGCVAVHTPTIASIEKKYPALLRNFRSISFDRCNIVLACASSLPVDAQAVGFESGQVAPEDVFNPFLHRAVSNESFEIVRNRMLSIAGSAGSYPLNSVDSTEDLFSGQTADNNKQAYYGLLASGGWKKALPQQGIIVKGLYPIAYRVLDTYGGTPYGPVSAQIGGLQKNLPDALEQDTFVSATGGADSSQYVGYGRAPGVIKGRPVKMPSFPLHNYPNATATPAEPPITYVWTMVTPPASTAGTQWYYRMRVTWHITLHTLVPVSDYLLSGARTLGQATYSNSYSSASKDANTTENMVDTFDGTEIEQVM